MCKEDLVRINLYQEVDFNCMKYLTSIIAVLLAIGCFSLPIGYYTFLRLVTCGGAVAVIIADSERGVNFSNILWAIVAVLFNPIFPVYLHSKSVWVIIDAAVALLFAYKTYYYHERNA